MREEEGLSLCVLCSVQLQQFPLRAAVVFRAANVLLLTLLSIAAADNNIR